jgi:UDP-N-acetylglucosamine 2-epimerase (non-hydrolysing)
MKIVSVVGARPNFMKIGPIVAAIRGHGKGLEHYLVHTGQHYDRRLSELFFEQLKIPAPDVNLEVGSGSHASQTAEVMKRFEPVCLEQQPGCVLVVGDVNSTLACALVASKLGIPVAHVEAGLRSFDRTMPEEINRIVTDAISDLLFTTEESANRNLAREGVAAEKVHFVGNVMIDCLLGHRDKAAESAILEELGLATGRGGAVPYAVLTLHRPATVDDQAKLEGVLGAVERISRDLPVVFPVHPRTRSRIDSFGLGKHLREGRGTGGAEGKAARGIRAIEPLGYLEFLRLMSDSRLVLTDSGGIQEETTILGVPCVTLRDSTERPATVTAGTNILAGTREEEIVSAALLQLGPRAKRSASPPPLWDGKAAVRIVDVLNRYATARP